MQLSQLLFFSAQQERESLTLQAIPKHFCAFAWCAATSFRITYTGVLFHHSKSRYNADVPNVSLICVGVPQHGIDQHCHTTSMTGCLLFQSCITYGSRSWTTSWDTSPAADVVVQYQSAESDPLVSWYCLSLPHSCTPLHVPWRQQSTAVKCRGCEVPPSQNGPKVNI